jgi:hypothetical protein
VYVYVCYLSFLLFLEGEKIQTGGFMLNIVKKTKRTKIYIASPEIIAVEAKQIGLGGIAYCKGCFVVFVALLN